MHSGACGLRSDNTSCVPKHVRALHSAFIVSRYAICITYYYGAQTFYLTRTQHTGTAFGGLYTESDVNVCHSKTEIQQYTAR